MAPRRKSITPKYFGQGGISDKVPRIVYTANALRFQSEEDLEIYIENHFDELFPDLDLLQRQFRLKTQRYDLLCRHKHTHQAVLLELKNEEDRGIVWQLVRYRKLIVTQRPFPEQIDYALPIELIAIAPSFHEDSLTDKEACKFEENIQLVNFSFITEEKIIHIGSYKHNIPYSIMEFSQESSFDVVPKWSQMCETVPNLARLTYNISDESRKDFWNLRQLFLAQPKVKEIVNSVGKRVFYATSAKAGSKTLAEIYVADKQISLFIYLPIKNASLPLAGTGRNLIKLKRFEIIIEEANLFNLASQVKYLVLSPNSGVSLKEKENLSITFEENSSLISREGMPKWCKGRDYLSLLSLVYFNPPLFNPAIFQPLYKDLEAENPQGWWQEFQSQSTDKLGWFADLAIRAWRYKI